MVIMKHKLLPGTLLSLTIAVAGAQVASHAPTVFAPSPAAKPSTASSPQLEKPVARVNGTVLTTSDLLREEFAIFPYGRQHNGIPKDLEPGIRAGALKMIVFEELVYQETQRRKMTIPAATIQKSEAEFRRSFATPDEFNALMQVEFHGSTQLLDEKIRRSLLIDAFLKAEVDKYDTVTPADIRSYYDRNPVRFAEPETYTFQTISVIPPAKATADQLKEAHTRAEGALRQAKATKTSEEFGLLAEKISDDDYRVMMGQHKPIPVAELAPQVLKALAAMKSGDVSGLVQVDQIITILRLEVHSPAGKAKFEDVKASLEKELLANKKEQLRSALDKKLRENAKVELL
jgi:parvulin-like peptidyl-prolyl isomerase